MLSASNLSLTYGKRVLFKEVNIHFSPGNCYGLIGANGSGKSTFLKILAGMIEPSTGSVSKGPKERMAFLKQDHHAFDDFTVMETVIMGHEKLYQIMKEKDEIYLKPDFSDEDGIKAAELESEFAEMGGYEAESKAAVLLDGLGIGTDLHSKKMRDIEESQKVRVLLAQALFDNPDILLLDEPTNGLDLRSITWLEDFLSRFENTVIVVSHDRHFLDKVCTHIADIDFNKIQIYVGNYSFWYEASQLALKQKREENRKKEDKAEELKSFIQRFSANASKAKQATSRKKLLDKLTLEDIPASSRKFPYVVFKPERACGNMILTVENLSKTLDGEVLFKDFSLNVKNGDKIAFVGPMGLAKTTFFQILAGEVKPDAGKFRFGETVTLSYFPKENSEYFDNDLDLVSWLEQYKKDKDMDDGALRGFLGRMLFSGEEVFKKSRVLSGGEKVRCMLSRMMLSGANFLIFDEPTNHLDLESITSLNNGMTAFPEVVFFSSHDHKLVETVANRVIEFTPGGVIDRSMSFEEYLEDPNVQKLRDEYYRGHQNLTL